MNPNFFIGVSLPEMRRRLVALVLVPCLLADPVFSQAMAIVQHPLRHELSWDRARRSELFAKEALAAEAFCARRAEPSGRIRGKVCRLIVLSAMGTMAQVPPTQNPSSTVQYRRGDPENQAKRSLTSHEAEEALKEIKRAREATDHARKELIKELETVVKKRGRSAADLDLPEMRRSLLYVARARFMGAGKNQSEKASRAKTLIAESGKLNSATQALTELLSDVNVLNANQPDTISKSQLANLRFQSNIELPKARKTTREANDLLWFTIQPAGLNIFAPPQGDVLMFIAYLGVDQSGRYFFRESIERPVKDDRVIIVTPAGFHIVSPVKSALPALDKDVAPPATEPSQALPPGAKAGQLKMMRGWALVGGIVIGLLTYGVGNLLLGSVPVDRVFLPGFTAMIFLKLPPMSPGWLAVFNGLAVVLAIVMGMVKVPENRPYGGVPVSKADVWKEIVRLHQSFGDASPVNQIVSDMAGLSAAPVDMNESDRLFEAWLSGYPRFDLLIREAHNQGYTGFLWQKGRPKPLPGEKAIPNLPAGFDLTSIVYSGVGENIVHHGEGNGIFLWRMLERDCEFIAFDYGPGAINSRGFEQESLADIYDRRSYRLGPMNTGYGLKLVGSLSYLTRVISINGEKVHIVEKRPGFYELKRTKHIPARQQDFLFGDVGIHRPKMTGFIVHGFIPQDPHGFYGRFTSVMAGHVLGTIEVLEPVLRSAAPVPLQVIPIFKSGDKASIMDGEVSRIVTIVDSNSDGRRSLVSYQDEHGKSELLSDVPAEALIASEVTRFTLHLQEQRNAAFNSEKSQSDRESALIAMQHDVRELGLLLEKVKSLKEVELEQAISREYQRWTARVQELKAPLESSPAPPDARPKRGQQKPGEFGQITIHGPGRQILLHLIGAVFIGAAVGLRFYGQCLYAIPLGLAGVLILLAAQRLDRLIAQINGTAPTLALQKAGKLANSDLLAGRAGSYLSFELRRSMREVVRRLFFFTSRYGALNGFRQFIRPESDYLRAITVTGTPEAQMQLRASWVLRVSGAAFGFQENEIQKVRSKALMHFLHSGARSFIDEMGISICEVYQEIADKFSLSNLLLSEASEWGHMYVKIFFDRWRVPRRRASRQIGEAYDAMSRLAVASAIGENEGRAEFRRMWTDAQKGQRLLAALQALKVAPADFKGGDTAQSRRVAAEIAQQILREEPGTSVDELVRKIDDVTSDFFYGGPLGTEAQDFDGSHLLGAWIINELIRQYDWRQAALLMGRALRRPIANMQDAHQFLADLQKYSKTPDGIATSASLQIEAHHGMLNRAS